MQDLNELAIEWNKGGLSRKRERLILQACYNRYWPSINGQCFEATNEERAEIIADYSMNIYEALNTWDLVKFKRFETYMYQCIRHTGASYFRLKNRVVNKRTATFGFDDINMIFQLAPAMWDDYVTFNYDRDKSKC